LHIPPEWIYLRLRPHTAVGRCCMHPSAVAQGSLLRRARVHDVLLFRFTADLLLFPVCQSRNPFPSGERVVDSNHEWSHDPPRLSEPANSMISSLPKSLAFQFRSAPWHCSSFPWYSIQRTPTIKPLFWAEVGLSTPVKLPRKNASFQPMFMRVTTAFDATIRLLGSSRGPVSP
jgi:hypothetical protein